MAAMQSGGNVGAAIQSSNMQSDIAVVPADPSPSAITNKAVTTTSRYCSCTGDKALSTTTTTSTGTSLIIPPPAAAPPIGSHANVADIDPAVEPWTVVTKALMAALIESQPPATAASTLLGIFRPMIQGSAVARKEGKIWKERAQVHMVELDKHKLEHTQKHATMKAQLQELEQELEDSKAKLRDFESHKGHNVATIAALEKKVAEAQAAHNKDAQERKREAEALSKTAKDATMKYDKLRQELEDRSTSQQAEVNKLHAQIKEQDSIKAKLEEKLGVSMTKGGGLEEEVAKKTQEVTNLQARVNEVTSRKDALERQLALYQRIPTRRF